MISRQAFNGGAGFQTLYEDTTVRLAVGRIQSFDPTSDGFVVTMPLVTNGSARQGGPLLYIINVSATYTFTLHLLTHTQEVPPLSIAMVINSHLGWIAMVSPLGQGKPLAHDLILNPCGGNLDPVNPNDPPYTLTTIKVTLAGLVYHCAWRDTLLGGFQSKHLITAVDGEYLLEKVGGQPGLYSYAGIAGPTRYGTKESCTGAGADWGDSLNFSILLYLNGVNSTLTVWFEPSLDGPPESYWRDVTSYIFDFAGTIPGNIEGQVLANQVPHNDEGWSAHMGMDYIASVGTATLNTV